MCTMSWWREGKTYGVFFNRDEKKTRPRAEPPAIRPSSFLAPRDPGGGGTWISVNNNGLIIALLNRWQDDGIPIETPRSRGLLVWDLANAGDTESLKTRISTLDLSSYAPFTLIVMDEKTELRWDWTENSLFPSYPTSPVSSSSFKTNEVLDFRQKTYNRIIGTSPSPSSLETFHNESTGGAYSPRMCRPDAQTWSRSHIEVGQKSIQWDYFEEFPELSGDAAKWVVSINRLQSPFLK